MSPRGVFLFVRAATIVLGIVTFARKPSVPKQPSEDSLAQQNVTESLLLMDTNKNGMISEQEWMKYMEAEFDKLDKDKTGELDRKELLPPRYRSSVLVIRTSASDRDRVRIRLAPSGEKRVARMIRADPKKTPKPEQ